MKLLGVLLLLAGPLAAQEVCTTSGTTWPNTAFPTQTDTFTVEYDDTPNAAGSSTGLDGQVGLSQAPASGYTQWAVITRFSTANRIDAIDSTTYRATLPMAYVPGTRYHFRVMVNVPFKRYNVLVSPPGGPEVWVAQNFRFRAEQSGVSSLSYWSLRSSRATATHTVCNFRLVSTAPPPPPPPPSPPPPPPTSTVTAVTIRPGSVQLVVTQRQQFYGVVSRANGTAVGTEASLTWASSDTTIVVPLKGFAIGLMEARGAGTATITARDDSSGITGQAQVTVTAAVALSVGATRVRSLPTPRLFRLPKLVPGFDELPVYTGAYVLDFITGPDTTVVGHAYCTVSP